MVTLQTADNALKTFYLDAVTAEMDEKISPFLSVVEKTSAYVNGKGVSKVVRIGAKGGVGAGGETDKLPAADANEYITLNAGLKNLYGTIEISDKAVRASASGEGAFVNLLNDEMQALVASAKDNFSRMLFGDGDGLLAYMESCDIETVVVNNVAPFHAGMKVDVYAADGTLYAVDVPILEVDRATKTLKVTDFGGIEMDDGGKGGKLVVNGVKAGQELTGLARIFSDEPLYGVDRTHAVMKPFTMKSVGAITEEGIQKAIDEIEAVGGGKVNMIICSRGVRRALVRYCRENQIALPTMTLGSDASTLSFNGVPVVVDDYCPNGTMYLLNTDHFKLCQLCDWQWMEGESGKILKQVPGTPVYSATLVKYAELLCEKPSAQGILTGITEA